MKDSLGLRKQRIDLTCPACGKKFQEAIARLEDESEFACPHCGQRFNTDNFRIVKGVEKELDVFRRALKKIK